MIGRGVVNLADQQLNESSTLVVMMGSYQNTEINLT